MLKAFGSYLALGVICLTLGTFLGRVFFPKEVPGPVRVERVDRPIHIRDTVTVERPVLRTVYQTVTEVVRDTIYVPKDFDYVGLVSPSPIKFEHGEVVLTYYGLLDSSFVQAFYKLPEDNWSFDLSSLSGWDFFNKEPFIGIEAGIRYKKFTLLGLAKTSVNHTEAGVGLKYSIVHF